MLLARLHQTMERVAREHPERPALTDGVLSLRYGALFHEIRSRSAWLRAQGAGPGKRICVVVGAGTEPYLVAHAVWRAGATFVPISREEAEPRARAIMQDARPAFVVAAEADRAFAAAIASGVALKVIPDRIADEGAGEPAVWREAEPLYILHTSGSTGRPKGVPVSASCVQHFVSWAVEAFGISASDRIFGHTRLTFDLSVFDLFVPFLAGASLDVPASLAERIFPGSRLAGITATLLVPGVTAFLTSANQLEPGQYPALRHVLFCGEAPTPEIVRAWQAAAPAATVHNLYGPTEATVACSWFTAERPFLRGRVPIGHPIPGTTLTLLGDATEGELLISGPQVSPFDYLDGSAGGFVDWPGLGRSFRTGDRVRREPGGELVWLGRGDTQLKVRGFRVELSDVEANLAGVPEVLELICLAAGGQLHAVVRLRDGAEPGAAKQALEACAERNLPDYMRPSSIHWLAEFPRTPNGKLDRRKVAELLGLGN